MGSPNRLDPADKVDPAEEFESRQRRMREEERAHCGICLVEFEPGETLKVLDCKLDKSNPADQTTVQHCFHQECIAAWFRKK